MKKLILLTLLLFLLSCTKNNIPLANGDIKVLNIVENRKNSGENFYIISFQVNNTSELNINKTFFSLEINTNKKKINKSIEVEKFIGEDGLFYIEYNQNVEDDELIESLQNVIIVNKYFQ